MSLLAAVGRSISQEPRVDSNKGRRLKRKKGDGGQLSPTYFYSDGTSPPVEQSGQVRSEGYSIELDGNSKVRSYSAGISRINNRIGTLQLLSDGFRDLSKIAGDIDNFLSDQRSQAGFDPEAFGEVLTLATEYEAGRLAVKEQMEAAGGGGQEPQPLDLSGFESSAYSLEPVVDEIERSSHSVHTALEDVSQQFNKFKPELARESEGDLDDEAGESVFSAIGERLRANRDSAMNGQANLDPELVQRLLFV